MVPNPDGFTVGLIAASEAIWRWQYQIIQSLIEQGDIDVQVIFIRDDTQLALDRSIALIYQLDGKVFSAAANAFEYVDVSKIASNVVPFTEKKVNEVPMVDVLINFSESVVAEEMTRKARFGILTPIFSEKGELSSQSLGIEQYLNNQKQVCLSVLSQQSGTDGQLLTMARLSFESGSLSRNLNQYWRWFEHLWRLSVERLVRSSDEVVSWNEKSIQAKALSSVPFAKLSIRQTTKALARLSGHIRRKLKQKYLQREQWVLLFKHIKQSESVDRLLDFSDYQEISPPDDCFWADPFVVSEEGRDYVFFEELPFATGRGHLCCMEMFEDGSHSDPLIIIQESHHLSYPNVFEYESVYYLIPESGDKGSIDLYRCTEFPYQWEYHKTLIDNIHAYDATLIEYQGRWWLFATVVPELGLSGCEALHIFHADSPISTHWQSHLKNPVISDASHARPGGNFYTHDDQLYRVSQDCAGQYGAGLSINKVVQLTPEVYEEMAVSHHYPDWDNSLTALHTFNFNKDIAVSDALRVNTKGLFQ